MSSESAIHVFCGADRNEKVPLQVLEYSLRRHSRRPVQVTLVDNRSAPPIANITCQPYTRFSFGRFSIPEQMGYEGRAIYLDSDMVVLADIDEIDALPFGAANILIEKGSFEKNETGKHAAVMALNCANLDWNLNEIVNALGKKYSYDELMSIKPLLETGEMVEEIPNGWNELDDYVEGQTRLIHYTTIKTQPWVAAGHPFAYIWIEELRRMLADNAMDERTLREDVELGFLRPSLLLELGLTGDKSLVDVDQLNEYDTQLGFVVHRELVIRHIERKIAMIDHGCDLACAGNPLFSPVLRLHANLRKSKYQRKIKALQLS